jgi:DNA polymerase elongation subunit (family B)
MTTDYDNLLFGKDATEGIVAAELKDEATIEIFRRNGKKTVSETATLPFFILVGDKRFFETLPEPKSVVDLEGGNYFKYKVEYDTFRETQRAKDHITRAAKGLENVPSEACLLFNDPVLQYQLQSGRTMFKGMAFNDLRRMQIDLETWVSEGFEFPNAERDGDRIIVISISDSTGYEELLTDKDMPEEKMIERLSEIVQERDPDVIEGHNIFKFDLTYLFVRARKLRVKLALGRGGREASFHNSRFSIAERTIDYPKFSVYGRHVVDTWILVQFYDLVKREMESYNLKKVAKFLGLNSEDRTYIDGKLINQHYVQEFEKLKAYAMDDVRETRAISGLLSQPYFHQAQMLPMVYQDTFVRGNATKIDSLFMRAYLDAKHSIPKLERAQEFPGGYTDIFETGVVKDVYHCDILSLYPSIMLSFGIRPATDELGAFGKLLGELTKRRIDAKRKMEKAKGAEKTHLDMLQSTFKILINSFFGYLGFSGAHFGDFAEAERVTTKGQEILHLMVDYIKDAGGRPIEIDTDGIYFVPPAGIDSLAKGEKFVAKMGKELPIGISVELDGFYPAMLSYKIKNYALLDEGGRVVIKGSALKSRGMEKFQRAALEEAMYLILTGEGEKVSAIIERLRESVSERKMPVSELAKTETLNDTLDAYQKKVAESASNRRAAYEIALKAGRDYRPGDQISYYVVGEKADVTAFENAKPVSEFDPKNPDYNVLYYLKKVNDLAKKFDGLMNPAADDKGKKRKKKSAGESALPLAEE